MDTIAQRLLHLSPAVVCDALDEMGMWSQAMHPHVAPLASSYRLAGQAHTILAHPAAQLGAYLPDTYERWAKAYDRTPPGSVLVIAASGVERGAVWGELRTERACRAGAVGLVTDGYVRDSGQIIASGFPVFCAGRSPEDCRGRIEFADADLAVTCGGVTVHPGDYVLADLDGVVVIPRAMAEDVISRAEHKEKIHAWIRDQIRKGREAQEVVQTYLEPHLP